MLKLNLSSQIVLNKVPEQYYHPRTAVEKSELTRAEKVPTSIFSKAEEGASYIAQRIETRSDRNNRLANIVFSVWVQEIPLLLYSMSLFVCIRKMA